MFLACPEVKNSTSDTKLYSERLVLDFNCTRYFYYDTFLGIDGFSRYKITSTITCAAAYS